MSEHESGSRKTRVVHELKSLSITVLYIWILLSVFALHRAMILSEYHISVTQRLGFALLNAVIFAKFMWLGDLLHAGQRVKGKPLLYAAIANAFIFAVFLCICQIIEDALIHWWHMRSAAPGATVAPMQSLSEFAMQGVILFVVLIPFFLARGMFDLLGTDAMKDLLIGSGTKAQAVVAANRP